MTSEKGKGRAHEDDRGNLEPLSPSESSSLLSRVAASASGLARSTFAPPRSSDLRESAAVLGNAGKGRPSSGGSGNSSWAESSRSSTQTTHQAGGPSEFRTGHNEEHVWQSENEFSSFLDGIESFTPSEHFGDYGRPGGGIGDGLDESWQRAQPTGHSVSSKAAFNIVSEQEYHDGDEVLAILSDPLHDPFETPLADDVNYDWGLSAEQISQLRAMTKDLLPPPNSHMVPSADNHLNLIPKFEDDNGQAIPTKEAWGEQWEGVLTRYTDEVWGDLLPIVKDARREIQDIRNDPSSVEQPKSLRRLVAILGHLKQP